MLVRIVMGVEISWLVLHSQTAFGIPASTLALLQRLLNSVSTAIRVRSNLPVAPFEIAFGTVMQRDAAQMSATIVTTANSMGTAVTFQTATGIPLLLLARALRARNAMAACCKILAARLRIVSGTPLPTPVTTYLVMGRSLVNH